MAQPDYAEWSSYQTWTLVEAACLLSEIEPVPPRDFDIDRKTGGMPAKIYSDLKDAFDLKQITFVASRDRTYRGARATPSDYVTWAAGRGYRIPDGLSHLKERDHPAEKPEQRAARLARRVAQVRKSGVRAFLKSVASEERISTSRLKQIIKQALPSPTSKATPTKPKNRY